MKKFIVVLLLLSPVLASGNPPAKNGVAIAESENKVGVYGGMGIHMMSASGIVKFINASGSSTRVDDWGTAVEFYGGVEIPVSRSWGLKLEHSFLFKSYSFDIGAYSKDLHFDVQAPMAMIQYVIPGKGFFIKFSGGGGYHWGTVTPPSIIAGETVYRASGIGMRAEAEGQTAFDAHLFGYISGSLGFEALGKVVSADGNELIYSGGSVSLNYVTAGVRFGLMYYL